MRKEKLEEGKKSSYIQDFNEGISYLRTSGLLPLIGLFTIFNMLFNPLMALLPLFIKEIHLGGATEFSIIIALFSLGSLIGSILMAVANFVPRISSVLIFAFMSALGLLAIALAPAGEFLLMYIGMVFTGFSIGLIDILVISLLQIVVPLEMQGRVVSSLITVVKSASPLAVVFIGLLAELSGNLQLFFVLSPTIMLIVIIYYAFVGHAREFDKKTDFSKVES
jgi:MFS family permease